MDKKESLTKTDEEIQTPKPIASDGQEQKAEASIYADNTKQIVNE